MSKAWICANNINDSLYFTHGQYGFNMEETVLADRGVAQLKNSPTPIRRIGQRPCASRRAAGHLGRLADAGGGEPGKSISEAAPNDWHQHFDTHVGKTSLFHVQRPLFRQSQTSDISSSVGAGGTAAHS